MSLLIASLKSKPKHWSNCSRVYVMRVIEFDGELYVDMSGEQRFGAGSDSVSQYIYSPEDWADNHPNGRFEFGGSNSTIQYFNDIEKWKRHCSISNYSLDPNGVPLPPQGWEWDMEESKIYKKLSNMQLQG